MINLIAVSTTFGQAFLLKYKIIVFFSIFNNRCHLISRKSLYYSISKGDMLLYFFVNFAFLAFCPAKYSAFGFI